LHQDETKTVIYLPDHRSHTEVILPGFVLATPAITASALPILLKALCRGIGCHRARTPAAYRCTSAPYNDRKGRQQGARYLRCVWNETFRYI